MGNLGRLGKKWIENQPIAKYPHSTGIFGATFALENFHSKLYLS